MPTATNTKPMILTLRFLRIAFHILLFTGMMPTVSFGQKEPVQKPLSNARIQFTEKQHDFGDIVQGESVNHRFTFQNTGTEPLMILNVQTTCGCTAPEWPRQPIPPGEKGEIVVTFNSAKKIGRVNKIITVFTNSDKPEEKLKIVSNILPPTEDPKANEKPIKIIEK